MRFIKLGLISIVLLFLLVFAISLMMPSSVIVSRAVDINARADSVYMMVNDLSKWKLWITNYDSSKTSVSHITSGKNAQLTMDNTTISINETSPRLIKTVWQVGKSTPLPATFEFIPHDASSVTTLHWQFNQKVKWYPWEKFAAIFSEKTLGPFMDNSLSMLKKEAEHIK